MNKDDVIHDRIINYVERYGIIDINFDDEDNYYYFFLVLKETKPTKITDELNMSFYNFRITYIIIETLSHLNNIDYYFHDEIITENKIKDGSQLIIDILNNNYANTKYNFTIKVIKQYHWNSNLIESIKNYNLFPYLERIHPKKIGFCNKKFEESAYIIYDEMCKLQMTWIGIVAKASILHK